MGNDKLPDVENKPINWPRYLALAEELQQLHKQNEDIKAKVYGMDAAGRAEAAA